MMDETASWDLPSDEQQLVWDEAETKFWQDFSRNQEAQHAKVEQEYQRALTQVKIELGTLEGKRDELNRSRERIAQELRTIEEELAHVVARCDDSANKMIHLEQDYRRDEQDRLEQREKVTRTMVRWFRKKRGERNQPESEDEADAAAAAASASAIHHREKEPDDASPMEEVQYTSNSRRPAPKPAAVSATATEETLADVIDAEGHVIGPIKRIEPWNQWVRAIQELPIQRPVKIRRGRKFNEDHLALIYERVEAKGVKWLSCMIQATGEVQARRCQSCDKNQGAFDDCVIVGGPLFLKCGNCEWNRQGCHGAAAHRTNGASARDDARDHQSNRDTRAGASAAAKEEAGRVMAQDTTQELDQETAHQLEAAELKARNQRAAKEALAKAAGLAQDAIQILSASAKHRSEATDAKEESEASNGHATVSYPEQPSTHREVRAHNFTSGFTPANIPSRPSSRDFLTPTVPSARTSPQPTDEQDEQYDEELEDVDLTPITRENLALKHDGVVYTFPEIIEGVPLEKIDENHPYWDPKWPDIKSLVEPPLAQWQEKLNAVIQAKERGDKTANSTRFQLGRQVNRGHKILEYLEQGEICPYQLLGKKYTQSGKGSITSYDTLFRMCETLSELAKFGLDVRPVEWMRHRLYELWLEQGKSFNVSKVIHNFYNDPKLTHLRTKAGFKSIGRPSGGKAIRNSLGATPSMNGTPQQQQQQQQQPKKRKSTHSLAGTPMDPDASSLEDTPPVPDTSALSDSPHASKRARHMGPATRQPYKESHDAEHSDTDSWSGARLGKNDYRVYQVKSRLYTSSTKVTQYFHWVEDARCFEHQVLKEVDPILWGVHRDPIDFNVRVEDIEEIVWNAESLRAHIVVNQQSKQISKKDGLPRGDIMVAFKRETTLKRFIKFCRELKLKSVHQLSSVMVKRWDDMQSEFLPDRDDEASDELRE